jgi:serine-type anaerobic sulfatase-maturating enzyme
MVRGARRPCGRPANPGRAWNRRLILAKRTPNMSPIQQPSMTRADFHVLAKPTGAVCNLDCKYCFFLSKEMLYPGSRFRMADDLLETYIRQLLESQSSPDVIVGWQGGEPTLMGLEFFERSIAYVQRYKKPHQQVSYTLQTNGTRLDDAWCAFLKRHNVLVGLSVDGPRELHDAYRVDKRGQGSFDDVMRGFRCLNRHGVDVNVMCTVHAANADYPVEVYRFFRDELKTAFIQLIPIVERVTEQMLPVANQGWGERGSDPRPLYVLEGNHVTGRSVGPEQWGRFLIAIFDEWIQRDVGAVYVQMFDAALASWLGAPASMCIFSETCGSAVALEHNGDLYSCDHFVEPRHLLGNIQQVHMLQLVTSEQQRTFGNIKRDTLPKYCRDCSVRFACHGECPKNRFISTPDGEPGLNYLCAGYKAFFTHIDRPMHLMANLLRHGRYADEAMAMLAERRAASPNTAPV